MNIFFLIYAVFSFGMAVQCWTDWNITGMLGWLAALVPALILSLVDLFERKTEEEQEREDRAVEAYNKLLNAADNSKDKKVSI
jgi:hypothetical protein